MQALKPLLDALGLSADQAVAAAAGMAVLLLVAVWLLRRRRPRAAATRREPEGTIDVAALDQSGPSPSGPGLELYHIPMRLAVVVLCPAGRGGDEPDASQLPAIVDQLVPGLAAVLAAHRPRIVAWPPQLSSQGFANAFFSRVRLPGDEGKGSCWCAMAGRFAADGRKYQTGLVLRAAAVNNLGHVPVERDSQWLDMLRVRLKRDA